MSLHLRRVSAVGLSAAAALTLGAGIASASASHSATARSAAASHSAAVAAAKAEVKKLEIRPTSFQVPSLPSKPPTGKTVDFVVCATPTCEGFVPYLRDAVQAVGWKLQTVQGGFEPDQIQSAWNKVLRNKPNGVIASGGIPPSLFETQLKQLHAEGIPVVLHDQEAVSDPNVTGFVLSNSANRQFGQELADLIVADSNGKNVHAVIFDTPQVPVFANEDAAITSTLNSSACQGCSVAKVQFNTSAAGTTLPAEVVSYLRAHPTINYVYFGYNDAVDGVPAALQQAGLSGKVKLVINNIAATEASYVKAGTVWAAAANPWPEVMWQDLNVILAKVEKAPLAPVLSVQLPNWIITKQNLPNFGSAPMFPLDVNYQAVFKKAWHLS
jgi:ABC-type sugar transport system substrate-binding protein